MFPFPVWKVEIEPDTPRLVICHQVFPADGVKGVGEVEDAAEAGRKCDGGFGAADEAELLGGIVFAVIVGAGEGRRAGTMGQIALFGIAAIDLALAIPSGIAPIALLLFASLGISGAAASGKDDVDRARAVFRDLRTVSLLLPAVVIAEILRTAISYAAVDASYATPSSLAAGTALGVSLVLIVAAGVFPFHGRLIKIFEALPIVGSLLVGVWIPSALALIVMSELSVLASGITDPLGGAIVPGILPIINSAQLIRFSDACGAEIPRWLRLRLHAFADDAASIKAFGLDVVTDVERVSHGKSIRPVVRNS